MTTRAYNTLAEIPGVDPKLKDQVVMLGGHMDSWHAAEGATDNGAGVAVAMEKSSLLLEKLDVQPRRTTAWALWCGRRGGDCSARVGYVKEHFGSLTESKDARDQILPSWLRPPGGPLELKPGEKLEVSVLTLTSTTA